MQLSWPPDAIPGEAEDRGHDHGAHHEGVHQHANADDEAELSEGDQRQHAERGEYGGEHDAGARDDAAGVSDGLDHARTRPQPRGLGACPMDQEDRVVDAEGDEEQECEDGHLEVKCLLAEQHPAQPCTRPDRSDRAGEVHQEQQHRRDQRAQQE